VAVQVSLVMNTIWACADIDCLLASWVACSLPPVVDVQDLV